MLKYWCGWCCGLAKSHPAFAEGLWSPEVMMQAVVPALRHGRIFKQRIEQAEVTQRDPVFGKACCFKCGEGELEDAGFSGDWLSSRKTIQALLAKIPAGSDAHWESGRPGRDSNTWLQPQHPPRG